MINLKNLSEDKLLDFLENVKQENEHFELKKAEKLPKSFWESYSSFANTDGGEIILGVTETSPEEKNIISGVPHPENIERDIWNNLGNSNKVSYSTLENGDIQIRTLNGEDLLLITVPEAPNEKKPIYLNGNKTKAYLRTGDGDRLATEDQIQALLRNANPNSDNLLLRKYTLEDLDISSVEDFKKKVLARFPEQGLDQMDNQSFLIRIGALGKNRETDEWALRRGTLLFFGKVNSIREIYPHYHMDFFYRVDELGRWNDRISDDDITGIEMNLFNFYSAVDSKLSQIIMTPFKLEEDMTRVPENTTYVSIREALINCLAHADYDVAFPTIKIEMVFNHITLSNPGKLLIQTDQFKTGGVSKPRNELILKFFRLMGRSERQGFGGPMIYQSAKIMDLPDPVLISNLDRTNLTIWAVTMASVNLTPQVDRKKAVLDVLARSQVLSFSQLKAKTGLSDYKLRSSLKELCKTGEVKMTGAGSAARYVLNNR